MLEIKTIWGAMKDSNIFDNDVNEALAEGWELVRREILPRQIATGDTLLYAELERYTDEPEEEEPGDDDTAHWEFYRRNILHPYKCSSCGWELDADQPISARCPNCKKRMVER